MSNLLVELGVEELPVDALNVIYGELKKRTEETLVKARVKSGEVKVEATPRRIALHIEGLAARQEDESLELSGPSHEKAYDAQGNPTPALQGFLKSKEATLADIQIKDTPKGKFIFVHKKNIGKPVASVLPQLLQELFGSLTFPKNMRWEKSGFRFPRPLRWTVALLDKKVIPFQFAGMKASNKSYGHRFLSPKAFTILSADWKAYQAALKKAHVILALEDRKKLIADGLKKKFGQTNFDEELLHTTAQLAEEPFLLQGSFSKDYLELPKEVLASCMKKNQKIFACKDSKGKLTGKFVAVLNGSRKGLPAIVKGYENVLESRLKDARYFYIADTKEKLESKLHLLEQVAYLGKLGNMKQKTERIEKLAGEFANLAGKPEFAADLKRAAKLSKIDLMTHLVYEFPDIQGIAGREYALRSGEKESIALAIGTQYLPKSLGELANDLKKEMNELGAMFGVLDRLDHLVGAFGIGLQPTGSQDPYALRRAAGSVVKITRAFNLHFSLKQAVEKSIEFYGGSLTVVKEELKSKLLKFFEDRLIFELQVKPGTRDYEILLAVTKTGFEDMADVYERFEVLSKLYAREPESFIRAAKIVERTGNIIKGFQWKSDINPDSLQEKSEKELFELLNKNGKSISEFIDKKDYEKATARFGQIFYGPVHDFFQQVMVNVEDPAIRYTRQALMKKINSLYTDRLADLSVLSRLDQG